jgi:valyl-tRNA synthetase
VITPEPLIDEYGADSVRYWAARARLGVDTAYDEQVFKVGKKLCTKLFNAAKFAIGRFSEVDRSLLTPEAVTEELDRAFLAEMRPLISRATRAFEEFDYAQALGLVEDFFWTAFCDNYLEMAKPRTYEEELTPGRLSACAALRISLSALVRMFAPFVPYISEEIWNWEFSGEAVSVHCAPWPTVNELEGVSAPVSGQSWQSALMLTEQVRKVKADANLSMAAPVKDAKIRCNPGWLAGVEAVAPDIIRMLRVDKWSVQEDGDVESVSSAVELE